jgi:hypothetical protein
MTIRTLAVHALILSAMVGCRQGEIAGGVTDSTFVTTMTALRRINANQSLDSAGRASARDSVLQGRDLTPEKLEQAARVLSEDPERALALWQRIMKESAASPMR